VLALIGAGRPGFDTFDVGGGFPVGEPGTVPTPAHFGREMPALLDALPPDRRPARLAVEPGRFLVASASWLVARVLHVRERAEADRVIVLDTGMTELIRPALYGATHPIVALTSLGRPLDAEGRDPSGALAPIALARVDGPICESTDTFDRHDLPPLRRGDLVAIREAGAYAASMAMTYNGRPAPTQAMLETNGALTLGRRRRAVAIRRGATTG
jgi:diaminopimelate decarboxylase